MDRNALIMEVLDDMEPRIQRGLQATQPQEREDLKQDIKVRLVKATNDMEIISFWTFKERFDDKQKNDEDGCQKSV